MAPPETELRRFTASDLDDVAHVHTEACRIAYKFMQWDHAEDRVRDWMATEKLAGWDWGLVARRAGQTVGYAVMQGSHLDHLFVLPAYQHIGIGRRLFGAALERGLRPMTLNVFEDNHAARAFYERHGFRAVDRRLNTEDNAIELRYVLEGPLTDGRPAHAHL